MELLAAAIKNPSSCFFSPSIPPLIRLLVLCCMILVGFCSDPIVSYLLTNTSSARHQQEQLQLQLLKSRICGALAMLIGYVFPSLPWPVVGLEIFSKSGWRSSRLC